jgi:hypothetical protein
MDDYTIFYSKKKFQTIKVIRKIKIISILKKYIVYCIL